MFSCSFRYITSNKMIISLHKTRFGLNNPRTYNIRSTLFTYIADILLASEPIPYTNCVEIAPYPKYHEMIQHTQSLETVPWRKSSKLVLNTKSLSLNELWRSSSESRSGFSNGTSGNRSNSLKITYVTEVPNVICIFVRGFFRVSFLVTLLILCLFVCVIRLNAFNQW